MATRRYPAFAALLLALSAGALAEPLNAPADTSQLARLVASAAAATLPADRAVQVIDPHVPGIELRLQLRLADGTPLAVDMDEPRLQISPWVLGALALQLALLVGLCAWAVRAATRPLRTLADAADALGADRPAVPLAEDGPREVQRAAVAFNHMQQRIQTHLQERMQIAHDLHDGLGGSLVFVDECSAHDVLLCERLSGKSHFKIGGRCSEKAQICGFGGDLPAN